MVIRTAIRGLQETFRAPRGARAWCPCLVAGTAVLLLSSAALADYAAGLTAFNRKDYAHAFSEWIESAKAGDAHAQHGLGMLYELGQGVPYADPKAAAGWYQKAVEQNYAPAINNLARLYADGRGVKQDVPKAIELWSKAAETGNTTARFNLGLQYAAGIGVKKDMKKAAEHLLQAAESGLPEAQFAIANYYRDGTGVAKDMDAARQWYDRAAAAGFEPARKELAAIDKPAVSETPGVEENAAQPAATGTQEAQKTETPPAEPAKTEAPPAPPAEAEPAAQVAPPPAEGVKQPEPPVEAATTGHAPAEPAATAPEEQPAEQAEGGQPAEEHAAENAEEATEAEAAPPPAATLSADDPRAELPVAESLSGEARVYRIWLYESGQEGDARSYWDKLTMQYPGLLKNLEVDLRRYFLGDAKGSVYRVFAGPFESLGDAQKACEDIKARFGDQKCRPVLN